MSVFGDNQNTNPQDSNNQTDYVAKVVEEKGQQWSDPQALAKGYVASQEFIKDLERQNNEMREELNKQDYAKEVLSQLQNQNGNPATTVNGSENNSGTEQEHTTPAFSEEQIKTMVEAQLKNQQAQSVKDSNLRVVDEKLTEMFGTEAAKTVEAKAKELGINKEQMEALAGDSPDAFFRLIGEAPRQEANPVTQGTINTSADTFTKGQERDWNYYQELRRTDPRAYRSAATQKQMFADRMRLGDKFGNN